MSLLSRIKRLWELSDTKGTFLTYDGVMPMFTTHDAALDPGFFAPGEVREVESPRRMATIVPDAPLDIFPPDELQPNTDA
jgi:hypothetical protein